MRRVVLVLLAAAPLSARALPVLQLFLDDDPVALGAGGVGFRDERGALLRLDAPALLAGAPDAASFRYDNEDVLDVRAPARIAGTHAGDLDLGGTVTASSRWSEIPAGVGVRFHRHRASLAAHGPPLGNVLDLEESADVATLAVGARPLPWLAVGGGVDAQGAAWEPRWEVRVEGKGARAGFAHRVDFGPARLVAPSGVLAFRRTPAVASQLDLGAPSDVLFVGLDEGRFSANAAADVARSGTWRADAAVRVTRSVTALAAREAQTFYASPLAHAAGAPVASLALAAREERWLAGVDVALGPGRLVGRFAQGAFSTSGAGAGLGNQTARALLGADVDLGLFADGAAGFGWRQLSVGYDHTKSAPFGFAVGAQALRLEAGASRLRYGSSAAPQLDHAEGTAPLTVDAVALTGAATLDVSRFTLRAGAAQLVPFRVQQGGARPGGSAPAPGGPQPSLWSKVKGALAEYGGGNVEIFDVTARF